MTIEQLFLNGYLKTKVKVNYFLLYHHQHQRSITQRHAASPSITQHHAAPRSTTQHHAAPRSTTQHHATSRSCTHNHLLSTLHALHPEMPCSYISLSDHQSSDVCGSIIYRIFKLHHIQTSCLVIPGIWYKERGEG